MTSIHERTTLGGAAFGCVLSLGVLMTSGCSVNLKHGALNAPSHTYSDQIATSKQTEGIDGKVGWGRFTAFYIPIVPVYIYGDSNGKVMEQILDALQQVGYKVAPTETPGPAGGPVLTCKVNRFWFNNYTWLFPIVPTWGSVDLTVSLVSPSGTTLWSNNFTGSGSTLNFFNGYSSAANQSMDKILNDMVSAFSSEEFHRALKQT